MADGDISVAIRAVLKNPQAMAQAARQLQAVEKAAEDAGTGAKEADTGFDKLQAGASELQAALAVLATREIAQTISELDEIGGASLRAEASLNSLSGGNADAYLQGIGDASLDTVSDLDALAVSNRALRLNVVENAEQMESLTRVAVAMGRTMGVDSAQALEDLTTGIARNSIAILDNQGIIIDRNEQEERAAELMAQDATLTQESADIIALRNMIIDDGNEIIADMGGLTVDAAASTEQLAAAMDDAKAAMGRVVAEGTAPLKSDLAIIIDYMTGVSEASADSGSALQFALSTNIVTGNLVRTIRDGADAVRELEARAEAADAEMARLEARGYDLRWMFTATTPEVNAERVALEGLAGAVLRGERPLSDFIQAQDDAKTNVERLNEVLTDQPSAQDEVAQAYVDGLISLDEYEEGLHDLMSTQQLAAEKAREERDALNEAADAARNARDAHDDLIGVVQDMPDLSYVGRAFTRDVPTKGPDVDMYNEAGDAIADVQQEQFELGVQYDAGVIGLDEYNAAMDESNQRAADAAAIQAVLADNVQNTTDAYIAQMSAEDQAALGEAYLGLFDTTGVDLPTDQLDAYRVQMGLLTQAQVDQANQVGILQQALEDKDITFEQGAQIFQDLATGQIDDVRQVVAAIRTQETAALDLGNRNRDLLDQYGEVGPQATDAMGAVEHGSQDAAYSLEDLHAKLSGVEEGIGDDEDAAETGFPAVATAAEDAAGRIADSLTAEVTAIEDGLVAIQTDAPIAFVAMADAATNNSGPLTSVQGIVGSIRDDLEWMKNNPDIHITVHVEEGERQHGGPVLPGLPYRVGEVGPELFVPASAGYIVPNDVAFPSDSTGSAGAGVGAGSSIHFHGDIHVHGVQDMRGLIRELERELGYQGRELAAA